MLILGAHLKEDKAIFLALQAIFGLNYSNSLKICSLVGICPKAKLKQLRVSQLDELTKICREEVSNHLSRVVQNDIQSLIQIKHYRGIRHMFGLPARGQRTRTNAQTSKTTMNKFLKASNIKKAKRSSKK